MRIYATREKYSPISGKYPIPRAHVHVCACVSLCEAQVAGREHLEEKGERENPTKKISVWIWRREKVWMCG